MRFPIIFALVMGLGTGASLAQTSAGSTQSSPAADPIVDCIKLWDRTTHMTKQEWATACRRAQVRRDSLNIDETLSSSRRKPTLPAN